ncbi:hypothetical protein D3C78_1212450 [compost metagenome]
MRDHHQRTLEIDQRFGQRLTHVQIQVVGRFIEQQQVGALPDDQRQYQPRFLTAREPLCGFSDLIALETKAAKVIAQLLFQHTWGDAAQVLQRRFIGPQEFQLMLGEVTQFNALCQANFTAQRFKRAGQHFDQGRFAGTVTAQ